jgi:hypothetical protein
LAGLLNACAKWVVPANLFVGLLILIPHDKPGCRRVTELKTCFTAVGVVQWKEVLATDPEVPGSISGAVRFSENYLVLRV